MSTKFSRNRTPQPTPIICKTTSPCQMPPSPPTVLTATVHYFNIHTTPEIYVNRKYLLRNTAPGHLYHGVSGFISNCNVGTSFWYNEIDKTFQVMHTIDHPALMFLDEGPDEGELAFVAPPMMSQQRYAESTASGLFVYYISQ